MYLCNLFYERFLVPTGFRSYQSTLKGSTEYFCQTFREQTVTVSPGRSRSVPVGHGLSRSVFSRTEFGNLCNKHFHKKYNRLKLRTQFQKPEYIPSQNSRKIANRTAFQSNYLNFVKCDSPRYEHARTDTFH